MKIGRRPYERYHAVILDLFGKLVTEDDRALLLAAIQKDNTVETVLLHVEGLQDLNDHSALMLRSLAQLLTGQNKRLVLVRPKDEVLECLKRHAGDLVRFEIVENETDAFK